MKKIQICVIAIMATLILTVMSIQPASAHDRSTQTPDLVDDVIPDAIWTLYGGRKWDAWTCFSDSIVILLFGGHVGTNYVTIDAFTNWQEFYFVNALHLRGLDIVTPRFEGTNTPFVYNIASPDGYRWLNYTAWQLKSAPYGYNHVFLFGHSAGGVAVAYEIQQSSSASTYDAAVIASAPVNWPNHGALYTTAQTAQNTKVRTAFISHQNDNITGEGNYLMSNQMQLYFDNMPAGLAKEWHLNWGATGEFGYDAHDPFPDTCVYHSGETVADVAYNWYLLQPSPTYYYLTVNTHRAYGGPVYTLLWINGIQYLSLGGVSVQVPAGQYTIAAYPIGIDMQYNIYCYSSDSFLYDGYWHLENPTTVNLDQDKTVVANYWLPP